MRSRRSIRSRIGATGSTRRSSPEPGAGRSEDEAHGPQAR
jgi:hypothetical protein